MDNFNKLLIDAVKRHRLLWDVKHEDYHHRKSINDVWDSIGVELNVPRDTAKLKWKNLRDTFRKECRKIVVEKTAETPGIYNGSWCHFYSMMFLRNTYSVNTYAPNIPFKLEKDNKKELKFKSDINYEESMDDSRHTFKSETSSDNASVNDSNNILLRNENLELKRKNIWNADDSVTETKIFHDINYDETIDVDSQHSIKNESLSDDDLAVNNSTNTEKSKKNTELKRKKIRNDDKIFQEKIIEIEKQKLRLLHIEDDEDTHFFKSLIPYVKLLPPIEKLAFRTEIQNILIAKLGKVKNM